MSKRFWFLTALVCLAFFHVFAWYRIPVQYYLRHGQDFATPLAELAKTSLLLGSGSLLITLVASYFILLRLRKLAAFLAITLTLTFWVIYSLFGQFDPLVDENFARIDLERSRAVFEAAIFILLAALTFRYYKYVQKIALVVLAVAVIFYAGATARQVSVVAPRADSETARSIFNLSAEENLLIIEMAEFESGHFPKLLRRDPELETALDGFVYFPDTLGVASRPGPVVDAAIHSGHHFDPFIPLPNVAAENLEGGSVFSKLAMAGAGVRIFQRNQPCPYRTTCIENSAITRDTRQLHLADTLLAVDSALLIAAPEPLKNFVYRGGDWLLSSAFTGGGTRDRNPSFEDHAFLQTFAEKITAIRRGPVVTYLRLKNTALPASLSADCELIPSSRKNSSGHVTQQASCALEDLKLLLASLRQSRIYHTSVIVVMASSGSPGERDSEGKWNRDELVSSANPLLLIKPFASTGPLGINEFPAQITDLPATLCELSQLCRWPNGADLFATETTKTEQRQYLAYSNGQYDARLGLIHGYEQYLVSGPVQRRASWQQLIDSSQIESETPLNFSSLDNPAAFGSGWGIVEIDPTAGSKRWAIDRQAELFLSLSPQADYQLSFKIYCPPEIDRQEMELHINGHRVGSYSMGPGVSDLSYRIPAEYILNGTDEIKLQFANIANAEGPDERPLAMSFFQLDVGRVIPDWQLLAF